MTFWPLFTLACKTARIWNCGFLLKQGYRVSIILKNGVVMVIPKLSRMKDIL